MITDDRELLRGMWRECAEDLERWARAFAWRDLDPDAVKFLRILAQRMVDRAHPGEGDPCP